MAAHRVQIGYARAYEALRPVPKPQAPDSHSLILSPLTSYLLLLHCSTPHCQELRFSEEYVPRILCVVSCNCMKFNMSKGKAIDNDREEAIQAAGAQAGTSE